MNAYGVTYDATGGDPEDYDNLTTRIEELGGFPLREGAWCVPFAGSAGELLKMLSLEIGDEGRLHVAPMTDAGVVNPPPNGQARKLDRPKGT